MIFCEESGDWSRTEYRLWESMKEYWHFERFIDTFWNERKKYRHFRDIVDTSYFAPFSISTLCWYCWHFRINIDTFHMLTRIHQRMWTLFAIILTQSSIIVTLSAILLTLFQIISTLSFSSGKISTLRLYYWHVPTTARTDNTHT